MSTKMLGRQISRRFSAAAAPAAAAKPTYPAYATAYPSTDLSSIKNGVRVASESGAGETATIGIWVNAGTRHEKKAGEASLFEHMSLQGTKKRSQAQLQADIASIGGKLSSYTSRDKTVYYAQVFKNDVPKAMEIIGDVFQNSLNGEPKDKEAFAKKVANKHANSNRNSIVDHLHETAFGASGLGRTVQSSAAGIPSLSLADIKSFAADNHTADNVVVAGAGAVDHKQLVELAERHFGSLAGSKGRAADTSVYTGSDKRIRFDSMNTAHVALGFRTDGATSEHNYPLRLMQTILGEWSKCGPIGKNGSTRLSQQASENELVNSYSAFHHSYKEAGLFGLYYSCDDNKIEDAMWHCLDNLVRLCHKVSEQEVLRARVQLKAAMLGRTDGSSYHTAENIGRSILAYNRRLSRPEIFSRIDSLTTDDVNRTANTFINDEDPVVAAIGPIYELPDYNWVRRRTFWHRY